VKRTCKKVEVKLGKDTSNDIKKRGIPKKYIYPKKKLSRKAVRCRDELY